jgi:hypothetical protein
MGGASGTTTCPVCGSEKAFGQLTTSGGGTLYEDLGCPDCGYDYERELVNIKGEVPHRDDKGVFDEPLFYRTSERLPIGDDGKIRHPQEMEMVQTAEGGIASRSKGNLKPGDIPQAVWEQEMKEAAEDAAEDAEVRKAAEAMEDAEVRKAAEAMGTL